MSIRRILEAVGRASAIEIFSSLYATVDPWDALSHAEVLDALDGICRSSNKHARTYALDEEDA